VTAVLLIAARAALSMLPEPSWPELASVGLLVLVRQARSSAVLPGALLLLAIEAENSADICSRLLPLVSGTWWMGSNGYMMVDGIQVHKVMTESQSK
jgi:hypothetical protein